MRTAFRAAVLAGFAFLLWALWPNSFGQNAPAGDWPYYGGDAGGSRYSPLSGINRANVHQLKVAWTYHTGDISDGSQHSRKSAFETTPIMVDGTLYFSTAFNRVVALDPATGRQRWTYDPKIDLNRGYSEGLMNRGVSTWADPRPGGLYKRRIYIGTIDARLICVDAVSGKPCADFGAGGQIDLAKGIPNITRPGEYEETSPPAIIDGLVIVGSAVADNDRVASPSGSRPAAATAAGSETPPATRLRTAVSRAMTLPASVCVPRWDSVQHAALGTMIQSNGTTLKGFFQGVLDVEP